MCACDAFFSLTRILETNPYFFSPRRHPITIIMNNKNKNKNKDDNINTNSKEETEGRDTPLSLYSAIVGGEGQDFVATTLSTSAQVCDTLDTSVLDFIAPFPRIFNRVVSLFALSFSLLCWYDDDKCNRT